MYDADGELKPISAREAGVAPSIKLACGATAYWDSDSGCSYICGQCFSVVGSISQPKHCRDLETLVERGIK